MIYRTLKEAYHDVGKVPKNEQVQGSMSFMLDFVERLSEVADKIKEGHATINDADLLNEIGESIHRIYSDYLST